MSSSSILFLVGFLIDDPKSGGQIRVIKEIERCRAWGYQTCAVSIHAGDPPADSNRRCDIYKRIPKGSPFNFRNGKHVPWIGDYAIGQYGASIADEIWQDLNRPFDIIICEHPWLWDLAKKLQARMRKTKIVLATHNVEGPLKRNIFKDYLHYSPDQNLLDEIDALERRAVREADLTVAVSKDDAAIFEVWGGKKVILCPNGAEALPSAAAIPAPLENSPYAVCVGSYHPPNVIGFYDFIGPDLGYLPAGTKLAILGSMNKMIVEDERYKPFEKSNAGRIWQAGVVDQSVLVAALVNAATILIPIATGGGSNLKTAEALISARPIITTSFGMRGFEEYKTLPQVRICDDRESFQQAMIDAVTGKWRPRATPVQAVSWENCLAPLQAAFAELLS